MNARQRWIALALVATVAAALWPGREEDDADVDLAVPRERAPRALAPAPQGASPAQPAAVPERLARMQANLFPVQTWVPPPPPPKPYVPPPPPPPKPPPLPFKFLGRWVEGDQETVFLVQGEQPIPVTVGMVLPGNWRVDEINPTAVVFTYLPLDMQSTLGITP
jgi:hypothetical protein